MTLIAKPDLKALPVGGTPSGGFSWSPGARIEVFTKYDELSVDARIPDKIWGRWCRSADAACANDGDWAYLLRSEIRSYDWIQDCAGQAGSGVFKFVAVIGSATSCPLDSGPVPIGHEHKWCSPTPPNSFGPEGPVEVPNTPIQDPCNGWTYGKECLRDGTWSAPPYLA